MTKLASEREMPCPCCGAVLVVDVNLGRIVSHRQPPRADAPQLDHAQRILQEQERRREALFAQSFAHEQSRDDVLTKRFEEALEQAKQEPVTRPVRDFDLD